MRIALFATAALVLVVPAVWASNRPTGTLSIEGGRGTVVIRGSGVVVGRLAKGDLQIVDLSPNDQWDPRVNGLPQARLLTRGKDINFFIPGGRYRVTVRGDGVAISARGAGVAIVKAKDAAESGTIAVGDGEPVPFPLEASRLTFGGVDGPTTKGLLP
jgi:hypothetical protein